MKPPNVKPSARRPILEAHRAFKMACATQAFVRGNTAKFYEWLSEQRSAGIPHGPAVWICGDCHTGNLGPVADAKGRVEIQIRDLDQAVIGNPAYDLIRLALSLATRRSRKRPLSARPAGSATGICGSSGPNPTPSLQAVTCGASSALAAMQQKN